MLDSKELGTDLGSCWCSEIARWSKDQGRFGSRTSQAIEDRVGSVNIEYLGHVIGGQGQLYCKMFNKLFILYFIPRVSGPILIH